MYLLEISGGSQVFSD